jgi:aminoglycoside phosphotransferase (APT) family kinase protein
MLSDVVEDSARVAQPDERSRDLLELLRESLERPGLHYAEPLEHLDTGGEAEVFAFRLSGADGAAGAPLILRLLRAELDPRQVWLEAVVHRVLSELGYPVPFVVLAHESREPLGGAFVVMERLAGRMILEEVRRPNELLRNPLLLPRLLTEALLRVPQLLATLHTQLHALDPDPMRRALLKAGFAERDVTAEGRIDQTEQRVRAAGVSGLETGFAWLRRNAPVNPEPALCHGDFVFTNVCVEGRSVAGVIDWSDFLIADATYDFAGAVARIGSPVIGVPSPVRRLFEATQRRLVKRFIAACRKLGPFDEATFDYYQAYFLVAELAWSGLHLAQGRRFTGRIEERWLHPDAIALGVERFRHLTGTTLQPALPSE